MRHITKAVLLVHACLLVLLLSTTARAQTGKITGHFDGKHLSADFGCNR